jgi:hypothetical protein
MPSPSQYLTVRPRAFVLRVWCDEDNRLWGQVAEPLHDWRQPFADSHELLDTLIARMAAAPQSSSAEPTEEV